MLLENENTEGATAKAIEEQTSKLPSDLFLYASLISMGTSLALKCTGRQHTALFVGQWAAPYKANHRITGTFEIPLTKEKVYGKCVQEILTDVIHKIEDKDHKLSITLEDGVEALRIALLASK